MNNASHVIIAIDGPASSGKGMLAGLLAKHYGCDFLPTGNLYRVLAKKLLERFVDLDDFVQHPSKSLVIEIVAEIKTEDLFDSRLSEDKFSKGASKIASVALVREGLNDFQRAWALSRSIAILEGRDIGTVIFPEAQVKLFLTAEPRVRAERRAADLQAMGCDVTVDSVYNAIFDRDRADQARSSAPLRKADDAVVIDTTNVSIQAMLGVAISIIEKKIDNLEGNV